MFDDDEPPTGDRDLEALDAALHEDLPAPPPVSAPEPKRRGRSFTFKPGTRQAPKLSPPKVADGDLPWYAKVKPGESMMAAAEAEKDRMKQSTLAHKVDGEKNLGR